ncbi:MAG: hypothetical protein ACXVEF_32425 [Polyangiales bacterium]
MRPGAAAAELRAHEAWPEALRVLHAWHDGCSDAHAPFEGVFGWPRLAQLAADKRMLDELETDGDFTANGWQPGSCFDPVRTVLAPSLESWLTMHLRLTERGPAGVDDDEWVDWFDGEEDEIRAEIAPGFPLRVRAK